MEDDMRTLQEIKDASVINPCKFKVEIDNDAGIIMVFENNVVVYEIPFAKRAQARDIAEYLGCETYTLIKTSRTYPRVDGKKKGYPGRTKLVVIKKA
jgi:hypothetical protein